MAETEQARRSHIRVRSLTGSAHDTVVLAVDEDGREVNLTDSVRSITWHAEVDQPYVGAVSIVFEKPDLDVTGVQVVPEWLAEVLHVVSGLAAREHEGRMPQLVAGHAETALAAVPSEVLESAGVRR